MNLASLVAACGALLLYPGGLFFALCVWCALPLGNPRQLVGEFACASGALALLAAAFLPAAASPVTTLPLVSGSGPSWVIWVMIAAAALAATARATDRWSILACGAVCLSIGALTVATGTSEAGVITHMGGWEIDIVRIASGIALGAATPLLSRRARDATTASSQVLALSSPLAALGWLAAVLLMCDGWLFVPAWLGAILLVACVRGLSLGWLHVRSLRVWASTAVAASLIALAMTVMAYGG